MPTNNFNEWVKEHGDESMKSTKLLLDFLQTLGIGDVLEIDLNGTKHKVKRTSMSLWEFVCDCCWGRAFSIGTHEDAPVINKKKWYE